MQAYVHRHQLDQHQTPELLPVVAGGLPHRRQASTLEGHGAEAAIEECASPSGSWWSLRKPTIGSLMPSQTLITISTRPAIQAGSPATPV